jgi:hypothetical protein
MNEIRRLNDDNSDHYISFLEKHGLDKIGQRARMILPTDTKSSNVAGDGQGLPVIHTNHISLSALLNPDGGKE